VRANFEYIKTDTNELTIHMGDLITVIDNEDETWWFGELRGERGYFPASYVTILNTNTTPVTTSNTNTTSKTTTTTSDTTSNTTTTTSDTTPNSTTIDNTATTSNKKKAKTNNQKVSESVNAACDSVPVHRARSGSESSSTTKQTQSVSDENKSSQLRKPSDSKQRKDSRKKNRKSCHLDQHHLSQIREESKEHKVTKGNSTKTTPSNTPRSRSQSHHNKDKDKNEETHSTLNTSNSHFRRRVIALFDYQSSGPSELSLHCGDVITVLDDDPAEEWWEGECKGVFGFFPKTYVAPYPPATTLAVKRVARALFDYTAESINELTFKAGELITVLDDDPTEEWWEGERADGTRGFFPKAYVATVSLDTDQQPTTATVPHPPPRPPRLASAPLSLSHNTPPPLPSVASAPITKPKDSDKDKDKKTPEHRHEVTNSSERSQTIRSSFKERVYNYFTLRGFSHKRNEKDSSTKNSSTSTTATITVSPPNSEGGVCKLLCCRFSSQPIFTKERETEHSLYICVCVCGLSVCRM
jgi:hypothetical protein